MIFVTVGSELPFDRMMQAVDDWAAAHPDIKVFAQTGMQEDGGFKPANLEYQALLNPAAYQEQVDQCQLIIAHAGMGSIITALKTGKPLVIMPRREKFRETRNDHQVGTGERFDQYDSIFYAADETAMAAKIDAALAWASENQNTETANDYASDELLGNLERFIFA